MSNKPKELEHAVLGPASPAQLQTKLPAVEPISKMKTVVVMRHAEYIEKYGACSLHPIGENQIARAAEQLRGVVSGKDAVILMSSAFWVPLSGDSLGKKLGITRITKEERLTMGRSDVHGLLRDLPKMDASVIILVTHEPEAADLSYTLRAVSVRLENGGFFIAKLQGDNDG